MKSVFLILFLVSGAVHLAASYRKNARVRAASKVFIVSALLGWYCLSVPKPLTVMILALAFSWLGDVLLIGKGVKWFTLGGIAFMASHFFFILSYVPWVNFASIPTAAVILIAAAYVFAVCLVFRGLRPHLPKLLFYPMFLYLLINGAMNCFALYQLISIPCTAAVITFLGAILFFCSDSILFFVRFNKQSRWKSHFPVMVTYILAEFLITLGMILLA